MSRTLAIVLAWICLVLIPRADAFAQTASLTGKVTDSTGAAVAGAAATLTGRGVATRAATAASDGSFEIAQLVPGV